MDELLLEVDMAHSIGNKGEFNEGPFQGSLSEFKENTKQRGSTQALVTMQLSTLVLKGPGENVVTRIKREP